MVLWHLAALFGATTLILIHVALGARLRRAIGARWQARPTWRWPVDAALGSGTLGLALFVLGTVGLLHPVVVLGATSACAIVARAELFAAARELGATIRAAHAFVIALTLLLVVGAVAPPTEWDSLMYHLRVPLWFLEQGRVGLMPDSFHAAVVGGAHFATLPLLAAGLVVGPALMQVGALLLTGLGTVALAEAVGGSRTSGRFAVAIVIGCPLFVLVAITARVDVSLVLALLAAHLTLLAAPDGAAPGALDEPVREVAGGAMRRALPVAAILVGAAMAIKPLAGAYALALMPLGWRAARSVRPALLGALLAAGISAPWFVKNLLMTGAPLYPMGAPGWFEPWIAELFGSRVPPVSVDAAILRALPEARTSFNLADAFFAPDRLTIEGEGVFYALSPALLLLPFCLLVGRARPRAAGVALVGIAYAVLVIAPFGQINLRYLMPAIPLLAVAVASGVEVAGQWMGARISRQMRRIVGVALAVTALLPLTGAVRQRLWSGQAVIVRHALGLASAQDVWRWHPDATVRALAPVIANVRRLVPPDGKLLMLWESRGLPFGREVLADIMLSNWSYLAQSPAVEDCLAGTGITHILAGTGSVEYYVTRGADPKDFMLDRFAAFRERCLTGHAAVGPGFELFALRSVAR